MPALLCLLWLQAAQPPREPAASLSSASASVRGRATDAATGKPLRMVRVMLTPQTRQANLVARSTRTDNDGRYQFLGLPPASYVVSFQKARYANAALGQTAADAAGRPLTLTAGQALDDADLALQRAAAITGRVLDDLGDPLPGATVTAMKPGFRTTGRALVSGGPYALTDDRGQYRLAQLPPGDYFIVAKERADGAFGIMADADIGLAITAYPAATALRGARVVTVSGGSDTAGIDIAMMPATPAVVAGVLLDVSQQPAPNVEMILRTDNDGPGGGIGGSARTGPDGTFRFPRVLPGAYELHARYNIRPSQGAIVPLTVTPGADANLTVQLTTGGRIRGRVVPPEGATADPATLRINALPISDSVYGTGFGGPVAPDWTFDWDFLLAARIIRSQPSGLPDGWYLKSVMRGDEDITDAPISFTGAEVVDNVSVILTTEKTVLTGRAVDSDAKPVSDYTVIVFPDEPSQWQSWSRYMQTARPDQSGEFRVQGLPPGRYLAAAVRSVQQYEWFDKAYLERLRPLASELTLEMNRTATVSLKLVRP
jgi:Carboxypeptidase regulatory-like domain